MSERHHDPALIWVSIILIGVIFFMVYIIAASHMEQHWHIRDLQERIGKLEEAIEQQR